MKVMLEKTLPTGEKLRILRFVTPEEFPEKAARYWLSFLRLDAFRKSGTGHRYWQFYLYEAITGHSAAETVDTMYIAEVDGEYAARMWFAYSKKTRHGNFGHVLTESKFRKRGLMNELLKICIADFQASPAEVLCCASGNPIAVRAYAAHGFELIYGGETGPLALTKNESFEALTARCFERTGKPCLIREGTIGDQFECDKILAYCQNVYQGNRNFRRGFAKLLPDFCTVHQEALSGNGKVLVTENAQGAITGYAFAVMLAGNGIFDFSWHGDYASEIPALLKQTLEAVDFPVILTLAPEDQEKAALAQATGMTEIASGLDNVRLFKYDR